MAIEAPGRAPRLLVVADYDYVGDDARFFEVVRSIVYAARDQPVAIQLRAKSAPPGQLRALAARARKVVSHGVPLLLNGSGAIAQELGYDGVHWPEAGIPGDVASAGSTPPLRSASVHNLEALARAEAAGADYVVFGSVFEPNSKPGRAAGLPALREVATATTLPVIAIGGITPRRVAPCLHAGAHGVAIISGVLGATDPALATVRYLEALRAPQRSA